jgi:hypothetical protein
MEPIAGVGFLTSVLGGIIVAASNWFFNDADRERTRRQAHLFEEQARKTEAETTKTQAETTEIMRRTQTRQVAPKTSGEAPKGWPETWKVRAKITE